MEIIANGARLEIHIDGKRVFSVVDDGFDRGTVALYASSNSEAFFDDMFVQSLSTGAVLLSENFGDGDHNNWTVMDDVGTQGGPSVWSIQNGELVQTSTIRPLDRSSSAGTFVFYHD